MDIRGKSVLILGGYGLVGQAVARRLLHEKPREMTLLSLQRHEAEEATESLQSEAQGTALQAAWGDVFAFTDVKDRPRRELFSDRGQRTRLIESLIEPLSDAATGIAYQDIYKTSRNAYQVLKDGGDLRESLETLLVADYVPQLIRHVQV